MLSVLDISQICDVARSTASYWITSKGLPARRSGNKFLVSTQDLIIFLESINRPIPQALVEGLGGVFSHPLKPYQNCWEYWQKDSQGKDCWNCEVQRNQINECFTFKGTMSMCPGECSGCQYFFDHYTRNISFIHQMPMAAAIIKDMYIWSGNNAWAELCGTDIDKLIGLGIEEIIHPESIKVVINFSKKLKRGESKGFLKSKVCFENGNGKKITINLAMASLKEPKGAYFAIAEQILSR
ncbi:MAG: PAS domain S-box protein [Deltaproteobacteria bacterium]|nr:PAS domain S-box protein [Deltaproteobacteria bacterium]